MTQSKPNPTKLPLPGPFLERLPLILRNLDPSDIFGCDKLITVRINTLKISIKEAKEILEQQGIAFRAVSWSPVALILEGITKPDLGKSDLLEKGFLYSQGLSSMLPVLVLNPQPGERILDMCAAPGSKTTQMAAGMNNEGQIVAIENIRGRFYKLKSVLNIVGAGNVTTKMLNARRYRDPEGFDKILVDAPCSSEGRFSLQDEESFAYWSLRKIKEMVRKQRGLLLSASRLLKPGGVLVYSTCTFAPEENEGVIDWFLRKAEGSFQVSPIELDGIPRYPAIAEWEEKTFNQETRHCLRVLPNKEMEGFFVAKIIKTT